MFIVFSFHNKKATLAFKWLDAENYTTRDSAVYFSARGFYFTAIQPKLSDNKMTLLLSACSKRAFRPGRWTPTHLERQFNTK